MSEVITHKCDTCGEMLEESRFNEMYGVQFPFEPPEQILKGGKLYFKQPDYVVKEFCSPECVSVAMYLEIGLRSIDTFNDEST